MNKAAQQFIESLNRVEETMPAEFHFANPGEVKKNAARYSKIIASIVNECYGEEYPAPTKDSGYMMSALQSEAQSTAVWSMNMQSREAGQYGTLSLYDAGFPFGEDIGELGKSGSPSDGSAKYGFRLFESYWKQSHQNGLKYRSFFCTSRNCGSRPSKEGRVRAGIAVRYLVSKVMHMTQWGYAPWYLMPDASSGSYEMLDFFVRLPVNLTSISFIRDKDVYVVSRRTETFIRQIFLDNWGATPRITQADESDNSIPVGWSILDEDYQQNKNPAKLIVAPGTEKFDVAFQRLNQIRSATSVAILPLDRDYVDAQKIIENSGFVFCAVYPPCSSNSAVQGMWCRLNSDNPIILPKYYGEPDGVSSVWLTCYVRELSDALRLATTEEGVPELSVSSVP